MQRKCHKAQTNQRTQKCAEEQRNNVLEYTEGVSMNLEECTKLEEKYARQAVEQANSLCDPDKKVHASLSVVTRLHDSRVDLSYRTQPSMPYRIIHATLLTAAVALSAVTTYAVNELSALRQKEQINVQQAISTIQEHRMMQQKSYSALSDDYQKIKSEYAQLVQTVNGHQKAVSEMIDTLKYSHKKIGGLKSAIKDFDVHEKNPQAEGNAACQSINNLISQHLDFHEKNIESVVKDLEKSYSVQQAKK